MVTMVLGAAAFTVTDTTAGLLLAAPLSSLTVSENFNIVSDVISSGAVKVAIGELAPFNVTFGPEV
jgi:hypothetical protein